MTAATIVFIKETINKNDNYGKFIYFEMIESIFENTKQKHRILTLCISFWYLLREKFMIPEVVFMARSDVGSVQVSEKLPTHPTPNPCFCPYVTRQ